MWGSAEEIPEKAGHEHAAWLFMIKGAPLGFLPWLLLLYFVGAGLWSAASSYGGFQQPWDTETAGLIATVVYWSGAQPLRSPRSPRSLRSPRSPR